MTVPNPQFFRPGMEDALIRNFHLLLCSLIKVFSQFNLPGEGEIIFSKRMNVCHRYVGNQG